ncbi:AraC family transcriptional regulator [Dyadobacter sp. LJ53]|uniref:helix-turn-helix domain-containing protein n=1 Tax=Dyadobacter chenwenxiniae TaxID=2906456 RepID=UPI001F356BA5|nr:AraC family transcriptional regulator [Dyadobacter chenwenxiniae]MCF0051663.1 AraC family transcriptional regulator [Dyadobacter chenwenxiniae]
MKKQDSAIKHKLGIIHSSFDSMHTIGEQFISDCGLSYIISGSIKVVSGAGFKVFDEGECIFYRKNFLARFTKQPAANGIFQSVTVVFDQDSLLKHYRNSDLQIRPATEEHDAVCKVETSQLIENYFTTLIPFFNTILPEQLAVIKKQEAILLLLETMPELKETLFNFTQPGKIDLEPFMQKNFQFNIDLAKWAFLTGRSLAAFKRDFQAQFHTSPGKWLHQRRLEEAYYLITEKNMRPTDVYQAVGFETIAHFSYSFKKYFGKNASEINQ